MALRELVGGMSESSNVKRVFGDPIEKDGMMIVPVASVRTMFGGGEGPGAPATADRPGPISWGGGGAATASPVGVYVLKDGGVTWVPAVDQNKVIWLAMLTGIVSLLVLRGMVRTLARRD